jgi:hypothetical protein
LSDSGEVDKDTVLTVLRHAGVNIFVDGSKHVLSKGNVIEVQFLQPKVSRRMLHHFSRKFGISIHLFFNPFMLE